VAFLNGQYDFPEPILRKRQKELQDLVDRSIVFREQVKDWLVQAHDSLFYPLHAVVDSAVAAVCMRNNLAYAIDTEQAGYKFINPAIGFDITDALLVTILTGETQVVVATGTPKNAPVNKGDGAAQTEGEGDADGEAAQDAAVEATSDEAEQ
jgi:hypothetical protein